MLFTSYSCIFFPLQHMAAPFMSNGLLMAVVQRYLMLPTNLAGLDNIDFSLQCSAACVLLSS